MNTAMAETPPNENHENSKGEEHVEQPTKTTSISQEQLVDAMMAMTKQFQRLGQLFANFEKHER